MKNLRNRVNLIGNLGADPEIKTFDSGKKFAKLLLATSETIKGSNGQKKEETQWHNLIAWEGLADIAQKYLKKGKQIAIEGKINYRSYEDSEGHTKYITEIIVSDLLMLSGGPKSN